MQARAFIHCACQAIILDLTLDTTDDIWRWERLLLLFRQRMNEHRPDCRVYSSPN